LSTKNTTEKERFWENFRRSVVNQGVPAARAKWYVRWAETFAKSQKGHPLKTRTLRQGKAFLDNLETRSNLASWQVRDAKNALRLLYVDFLKVSWATKDVVQTDRGKEAKPSAQSHFSQKKVFRDPTNAKAVDAKHGDLIKRLRTEIRARHYSIRTEQTYEDWVRRFVTFHHLASPHS